MANPIYNIKDKPEYQREIPAITTQTPAHAETVLRPLFESVINNTEFVRQRTEEVADQLDEVVEGLTPEDIGADPAGSAASVKSSLDAHTSAANPHSGSVSTSRTVNGKTLSGDVTLTAGDVGARASNWMPTAAEVGAVPTSARGVAGGVATLDTTCTIPLTQFPSVFLDLEAKLKNVELRLRSLEVRLPYNGTATEQKDAMYGVRWTVYIDNPYFKLLEDTQINFQIPANTVYTEAIFLAVKYKDMTDTASYSWVYTSAGDNLSAVSIKKGTTISLTYRIGQWTYFI